MYREHQLFGTGSADTNEQRECENFLGKVCLKNTKCEGQTENTNEVSSKKVEYPVYHISYM